MATTFGYTHGMHFGTFTLNWTADGSISLELPDKCIRSIAFTSDGADGGGTLTWFVSENNSDFAALGVNTATDPANPTTITSATAAGTWVVHEHDTGHRYWKFTLGSSTSPNLNVTMHVNFY